MAQANFTDNVIPGKGACHGALAAAQSATIRSHPKSRLRRKTSPAETEKIRFSKTGRFFQVLWKKQLHRSVGVCVGVGVGVGVDVISEVLLPQLFFANSITTAEATTTTSTSTLAEAAIASTFGDISISFVQPLKQFCHSSKFLFWISQPPR